LKVALDQRARPGCRSADHEAGDQRIAQRALELRAGIIKIKINPDKIRERHRQGRRRDPPASRGDRTTIEIEERRHGVDRLRLG